MLEKVKNEFYAYLDFMSFHCPKCCNFKDIFNGNDSYERGKHTCNSCGAVFEINKKDPILEGSKVSFPMKFVKFMCFNCECNEVPDKFTECSKCKEDRKEAIKKSIEHDKKLLNVLELKE